jgi:SAM-dependent methyltransferase
LHFRFRENSFDAAFSFHVFMHLEIESMRAIFAEVARVLKPEGVFIADVASRFRRRIHGRRTSGWHGSISLTQRKFGDLAASAGLKLRRTAGVALIPIHRIPSGYRSRLAVSIGAWPRWHRIARLIWSAVLSRNEVDVAGAPADFASRYPQANLVANRIIAPVLGRPALRARAIDRGENGNW